MQLNQVTLACLDYDASVSFYKQLGLIQIVDAPPDYARFEAPDGEGATLSIHAQAALAPQATTIYFDYPSAQALDAQVRALQESGLTIDTLPEQMSWGWREARLRDPAGNQVCLMFAGDNRRFPAWRLDGRRA